MSGDELRVAIGEAGLTQSEFAEIMDVHRTVIGRQYKEKKVSPHWVYALGGLIALRSAQTLTVMLKP